MRGVFDQTITDALEKMANQQENITDLIMRQKRSAIEEEESCIAISEEETSSSVSSRDIDS
jgi:hypothetical protein